MPSTFRPSSLLFACVLAAAGPAVAGESPFGWLYTTDVHPAGTREFEQHLDVQAFQTQGHYVNALARSEFEFGITSRYQTSVYLNYRYIDAYRNGIDGTTGGPNTDIHDDADPLARYKLHRVESVSWENIYQIFNPIVDPFGLALYLEPSWGPRNKELEFKILLQKNFLDDRLIWAANLDFSSERNDRGDDVERASEINAQVGVAYRFRSNWSAGLELRNHREFEGYRFRNRQHSAWFLGPNVHYGTEGWWFTAAWRRQLPFATGFTDDQRDVIAGGKIYGDEHTRDQFIVKVGIPF